MVEKPRSRKEKWFTLNHPALNSASLNSATLNSHHPFKLLSIRNIGCALENWAEVEWDIHLCHKVMGNQTFIFHLPPAKEEFCFQNVYKRNYFKLCVFLVVRNGFCMRYVIEQCACWEVQYKTTLWCLSLGVRNLQVPRICRWASYIVIMKLYLR